jgi:3-oxoacyl-[acyl-carrier-protein] synthase-3
VTLNALKAKIIGIGSYVPKKILSNADLERMVNTSDEWIVSRTGIRERRIAAANEYTSEMGFESAKNAIQDAGITPQEIDFILVATVTPDHAFPSTACLIQEKLGIKNVPAFDLSAACSGFIYALKIASSFVEQGAYKNILIVAADKMSSIINYKDRSTCVLFGDGAFSCVVSMKGCGLEIQGVSLGADGEQAELLKLPAGGSKMPATQETVKDGMHYIHMGGNETFKHAVRRMEMVSKECMDMVGLTEQDISWLIPHQANERIISAIAKRFEHLSEDRVYKVIQKYGNTSASSIGIALDELKKKGLVKNGEHLLLTVFGAGFTWGAAVLTCKDEGKG